MELYEKIRKIRKARGFSQEELGNRLSKKGISRQSISDWENGYTEPRLDNIRDLAKVLNVSYDSLLDDSLDLSDPRVLNTVLNNEKQMASKSHLFHYEYKSERMIGNLPLIHINIGTGLYVAKGIIAIGNFSFGLVSLGIISLGLLSLGAFSLGLISFGAISIGILLALGSISAGFISLGACAFGYLSIGACAIGNYSLGAYAYGATLSYGAKAEGGLAFSTENGAITFTKEYIKMMIEMHLKDIPTIIKNIFINLGN